MSEKTTVINISERASGEGLKEDLTTEAARWGMTFRPFVGRIYDYALQHQSHFVSPLKDVRPKGGKKVAASVSPVTARKLTQWAEKRGTKRGHHCCYILEKALEDGLMQTIFGQEFK
jgi:hypothetical protein